MSKDKRSSVIYHEWVFKYESELTDEEFGLMFKAIAYYGQYGEEPVFEDRGLRLIWNDIKIELDKNRESWEKSCETKRQNGMKGGRPKKNKTEENPVGSDGLEEKPNETEENQQVSEEAEEKPTETYRFLNAKNKTYGNMNNEYMNNDLMINDYMINDINPPYIPPKRGEVFVPPTVEKKKAITNHTEPSQIDDGTNVPTDVGQNSDKHPPEIDIEIKKEKEIEKYDADISPIVEYLNEKTGKSYKVNSKETVKLIKARMKEGFTVEDFKTVIDKKTRSWLKDPKMNDYLRPQTLFSNKFEGYLNEEWKPVTTKDIASSIDWTQYMD